MSILSLLATASTEVVDLGGVKFKIRRLVSRDLDPYRGYQLLLYGVPDAELLGLGETISQLVAGGADPLQVANEIVDGRLRLRREKLSDPQVQAGAENMRAALLAAGVTHWSEDGAAWRPVRIQLGETATEGDGDKIPDICPIRYLPGGGGGEETLCARILDLSRLSDGEADRLARFRLEPGQGEAGDADCPPVPVSP